MLVVAASSSTVAVSATATGPEFWGDSGVTVTVNVPVSSVSVPSDTV